MGQIDSVHGRRLIEMKSGLSSPAKGTRFFVVTTAAAAGGGNDDEKCHRLPSAAQHSVLSPTSHQSPEVGPSSGGGRGASNRGVYGLLEIEMISLWHD